MKRIFLLAGSFLLYSLICCSDRNVKVNFSGEEMVKIESDTKKLNEYYKKALVTEGNPQRIASAMKKALNGDSITIGVIGGSITAGANASKDSCRWANIVYEWWTKKFPNNKFNFINAGIGATNSIFGTFRAENDLLKYNPDFVVVEFSNNDIDVQYCDESYEGLLRKILKSKKIPGVLCLSVLTRNGKNAQEKHVPICKHYNIPMISQRDALKDIAYDKGTDNTSYFDEGSTWGLYSTDDVHPNDWGHAVAAALVVEYLESVYNNLNKYKNDIETLPSPLTANGFEKTSLLNNRNIQPASNKGWSNSEQGWIATSNSQSLTFNIDAAYVYVNFMRTNVEGKGGECIVDINRIATDTLSADFKNGWGNYMETTLLMRKDSIEKLNLNFTSKNKPNQEFIIKSIMVSNP